MISSSDAKEYLKPRCVYECNDGQIRVVVDAFKDNGRLAAQDDQGRTVTTLSFLSHYHSDHYGGLDTRFERGTIYCTEITRRLVVRCLGVPASRVHALRMGERYRFDLVTCTMIDPARADLTRQQVDVTLVDANHCPGAAMLLFHTVEGTTLHTGDFRFLCDQQSSPPPPQAPPPSGPRRLQEAPGRISSNLGRRVTQSSRAPPRRARAVPVAAAGHPLEAYRGKIDRVFLDNTFCDDKYEFPTQADAANLAVEHVKSAAKLAKQRAPLTRRPRLAVMFGTYTIGKERIIVETRRKIGCEYVFATSEKLLLLHDCEYGRDGSFRELPVENGSVDVSVTQAVTGSPLCNSGDTTTFDVFLSTAPLHSLSARSIKESDGKISLGADLSIAVTDFDSILCIQPTGWAMRSASSNQQLGHVSLANVPYSEHSAFSELLAFAKYIQPREIIPTVSVNTYRKFACRFYEVCPRLKRESGQRPITESFGFRNGSSASLRVGGAPKSSSATSAKPTIDLLDDEDGAVASSCSSSDVEVIG